MEEGRPIARAAPGDGNEPSGAELASQRLTHELGAAGRLRDAYPRRVLRGTFLIELPAQRTVRALALSGFDFVVIDLEHSPFGIETLHTLVVEAQAAGLPALVRVWGTDPGLIGKVLDAGASGVMVPRVSDEEEVRGVVQAARYSPRGDRGLAPLMTYSTADQSQAELGNRILVIVQVESPAAIAHAESMMAVPGLDALFVGPYDLSQALGVAGQVHSEQVLDAARSIAAVAPPDMMLGVYVDQPRWSAEWAACGFRLQCVSFDGRLLIEGARAALAAAEASHA